MKYIQKSFTKDSLDQFWNYRTKPTQLQS